MFKDIKMPSCLWAKKTLKEKKKKKPTRCQIKVSYDYERHQEGSGESHIFPGEAVVRPGAGNKKTWLMFVQIQGLGEDDTLTQPLDV